MTTDQVRVLLVDDDEDDYIIIRDLLSEIESRDYELQWERSYEEALNEMRRRRHDVYLLDYGLGEHTGLELLREAHRAGCKAPIILLTGRSNGDIDAQAFKMGAAEYLMKGKIDAPLLERTIRYSIKHKKVETQLRRVVEELQRSNKDLEQFAYVSSHELKEPLNMVVSYLQLLEKRYHDALEQDAKDFMKFAVDAARRMQHLVNDLLEYSRVSTKSKPLTPVDCNSALKCALSNLRLQLGESQALVTQDVLPTVMADETQLTQLFQNLIANAIKFHKREKPKVHISSESDGQQWTFSVKDNGIGIDPQYASKVFLIFQRLNARGEYPGMGIGLAICKRIVERYGGRIWFNSRPGEGTIFHFTIPVQDSPKEVRGEAGSGTENEAAGEGLREVTACESTAS